MEAENNLIRDYCTQNKVAIAFSDADQLDMIMGLFGEEAVAQRHLFLRGGVVSFFKYLTEMGRINFRVRQFYSKEFYDHILLKAEEFFFLAMPNRSILEFIK